MSGGAEGQGTIRVLYIDDDEALGRLVAKAFRRHGHEVVHARSGAEGLATIAGGGFDAIALDHTMPGETGLDVLARLGEPTDRPPVVYVTGSGDARIAVEALKSGAEDYVIKDLSGEFCDLLIAAVDQALERSRLRRLKAENERAVREARDRAELLLREMNHRIANSLGLVAAMVRMQASVMREPSAVKALQETQGRIAAIAGVHRRLYTSEQVGLVEADDYLRHLVDEIASSLRDDAHPYIITFDAEKIALSTDRAVSLGVIVTELVTNAFKYAYAPGQPGEIRVAIGRQGDQISVVVSDDGAGFDPTTPSTGTGLGGKILDAMAVNLRAEIRRDAGHSGTHVAIVFPAV